MIDLSNLKSPGWQRVVAELIAPVPDDRTFLCRLVSILGQVGAARQGALWEAGPDSEQTGPDLKLHHVWIASQVGDSPVDESTLECLTELKSAARAAIAGAAIRVFSLDRDEMYESQPGAGYVVGIPIASGSTAAPGSTGVAKPEGVSAVITLLLDGRTRQALQTTLALIEVLTGYVYHHGAQQSLRRVRAGALSLDLAARLISSINTAQNSKAANLQLVNDLCRHLNVDRVALGWVSGGKTPRGRIRSRAVAMSDTEHLDRRMQMVQQIEAAMDECLDQEQAVLYPPPPPPAEGAPGSDEVLSSAITRAHRDLAAKDARLRVGSVPMRIDDRVVGVLLLETSGDTPLDAGVMELLQATMDLVAPVLEVRRTDDRWISHRVWDWLLKVGAWAVGPKHTVWKLAGLALTAFLLFATLVPVPYRVSATMELSPREPRTVSMPFEGRVAELGPSHKAGDSVQAGDLLIRLETTELELQRLDALPEIARFEKASDEGLKRGELGEAARARAQADQAKARLKLIEHRIAESRITAPIGGQITTGDMRDKLGASIRQGEALFTIADTDDMVITARVDDRDIALIREGMTGHIATRAEPRIKHPFTVERIVPQAAPKDGKNVYHVRCLLTNPTIADRAALRPGMEGRAKFDVDRRSLVRIGARRFIETARLWLWW